MADPGSWAVTLPDQTAKNSQMMQMLWQHNMQQNRFVALQQQREFQRKDKITSLLGKEFDNAKYATGEAQSDPLINSRVTALHKKWADFFVKNPDADPGEAESEMEQDLQGVSQYSAAVKNVRSAIKESVKGYDKNQIDSDSLEKGAMNNFLTQGGNTIVTDPNKLDLNKNYVSDELDRNAGHYVIGDVPYQKAIEAYKPQKGGDTQISEHAGVTTENKYSSSLYPHQSLTKDGKGNVTGVQTSSVPATLSNGQTLNDPATGKPLQIVDDETFNRYNKPEVKASLRRDVTSEIQKEGLKQEDFPVGSEGYNILAKHVLYNKLNQLTPSEFTHEVKKTNANFIDRMQAGLVDAGGRAIADREKKHQEALMGSNYGKIRLGAKLDPTVLSGGKPYQDPATGKNYIDITEPVGGFNTLGDTKGTNGTQQVKKIMVDPNTPGSIYTEENGEIREYKGNDINGLLTAHGPANGFKDLKDIKTVNDLIPITPDPASIKSAQDQLNNGAKGVADLHVAQRNEVIKKGLDHLDDKGDGSSLKNISVPDGKVADINIRNGFRTALGADKYSVDVTTGPDKVKTLTFPTRAALEEYLKGSGQSKKKSTEELGKQYGF